MALKIKTPVNHHGFTGVESANPGWPDISPLGYEFA